MTNMLCSQGENYATKTQAKLYEKTFILIPQTQTITRQKHK